MKFLNKLFCKHQWAYKAIDERFDQFNVAYTVRKRCLKCGKIQRFYGKYGKEEFEVKRNGYQPKGENPPATTPKPPISGSGIKNDKRDNITEKEKIMILSALLVYEDKFREMFDKTKDTETLQALDNKIMQIKELSIKLGLIFNERS